MQLENYRPKSQLVVPVTPIERPHFPVFDAHNHLDTAFGGGWIRRPLAELCAALDEAGVTRYVDLDGGWGEDILARHLETLAPAGDRFLVFGGVDWSAWPQLGEAFPEHAARLLEAQKALGARGLKIWKPFGLSVQDQRGKRVPVNDPRLDPIWQAAGELALPVVIHTADPVAFFDPLDETNERWEELSGNPDWVVTSPPYPPFLELISGLACLVERHPGTTFIGAHVGGYAENLAWIGALLERCPNFNVDIAARLGELGRQPYTARDFITRYADRVLFGSDFGPDLAAYRLAYRILETRDEYFNYSTGPAPEQGRWYAYGLGLPDDVLEKIYHLNAERLLAC